MKIESLKNEIEQIDKQLNDPMTPQGLIAELKGRKSRKTHELKIAEREHYEKTTNCSVYGSDDYVGATAGEYSFYYGYEETACPKHGEEYDCYENDCDDIEWCFIVRKGDEELVRWRASEIEYEQADDIERVLIIGMARFINERLNG